MSESVFSPFKYRVFSVMWLATLISNIGTWMFNVTSGWMMTALSPSPLMVALVQAATALPIFLFALPAGVLGDLFNRRKLLIWTQTLMAIMLFVFAALLWKGITSPWTLLAFTFAVGVGTAFSSPAWQATVPRLVPRNELASAIVWNGVSMNIARAIGPALGGFVLAAVGAMATVFIDALSYLAVAAALLWWRTTTVQADNLPREYLSGALQAGIRFVLHSKSMRYTLIRALAFFTCASAYWALLPIVAKESLQGGPDLYGILLAALGLGAVVGAFLLPQLGKRYNANTNLILATLGTAFCLIMFALGRHIAFGILAGFIGGISWIVAVSALNYSAQVALPDWVRARGLAIFQMAVFGAMAGGSLGWGQVVIVSDLSTALVISGLLTLILIPITYRFKLNLDEHHDHTPSGHWAEPIPVITTTNDSGPVLVTLEYRIADDDRDEFFTLMQEFGVIRRRDGAIQWGYFEDIEQDGRFVEMFVVESWVSHLRQHVRVSAADKILQDKIFSLHQGTNPPIVTHAIAPQPGKHPKAIPKSHRDL